MAQSKTKLKRLIGPVLRPRKRCAPGGTPGRKFLLPMAIAEEVGRRHVPLVATVAVGGR